VTAYCAVIGQSDEHTHITWLRYFRNQFSLLFSYGILVYVANMQTSIVIVRHGLLSTFALIVFEMPDSF